MVSTLSDQTLIDGAPSLVPVMLFVHDYPSELVFQHPIDAPSELLSGFRNTRILVGFVIVYMTVTIGNSSASVCTTSPSCM